MESAALTRREPGSGIAARARRVEVDTLVKVAFAVLCVGFLVGFLVFPTYPNYDSYYSLLWGREVLDLQAPFFEGFRVPTEHPLAIAAGALLSLLGEGGDRVWVAMTLASFLWLVWGIYRLGQVAFTPLVGAIAALLLLTRFDFAFLAARGYVDVPYMALVVWAAVMEAVRPRRGWPVFALLALAGLLRPEAWILSGLYFLWMSLGATWGERARYAALAAIAPLGWAAVDFARHRRPAVLAALHELVGRGPRPPADAGRDPLGAAVVLREHRQAAGPARRAGRARVRAARRPAAGGDAARAAAERHRDVRADRDRRPVGDRALPDRRRAGAARVRRRRARGLHDAAAGAGADRRGRSCPSLLVLAGVGFTATRVDLTRLTNELQFRGDAHTSLVHVLNDPAVKAALRCGPLTAPNHKLVPDARWILDLPRDKVLARADPDVQEAGHLASGVALYVTTRFAIFRHAFTNPVDPTSIQIPPPGWRRIATSDYVAAYARC